MKYDGSNPLHVQQARAKLEKLIKEQKVFELTEKKPQRSLNQNKYLWLLIEYWATQTGYTKDEAEFIYKEVNKDIYFVEKEIAGIKAIYVRHTYELDTKEMSLSVEKWRNWSVMNDVFPVYLPAPNEEALLQLAQIEVDRMSKYLKKMKLTLTKQEVLLIQLLLHIYKNDLPDDVTEKHGRFVGKLYKKIKRQVINQLK
jgi:hypothetical protein